MLLIAVKIGNTNLLPPAAFNEFDYGQGCQEGGATGAFCPGPHSACGPQKYQYTLIEQSNTLLKQSLHIFALGPSSSLGYPDYGPSINFKFKSESFSGAVTSLITYMLVCINVHSLSNNFDEFTLI